MSSRAQSEHETKGPGTRHVESNSHEVAQVLENDGVTAKVVHVDGTVDIVDAHTLGGELDVMPKGYFTSPQFIGTVTVRCTNNSVRGIRLTKHRLNVLQVSVAIWAGCFQQTLCEYFLALHKACAYPFRTANSSTSISVPQPASPGPPRYGPWAQLLDSSS